MASILTIGNDQSEYLGFQGLPLDLKRLIFDCLSPKEKILAKKVSKEWFKIIEELRSWTNFGEQITSASVFCEKARNFYAKNGSNKLILKAYNGFKIDPLEVNAINIREAKIYFEEIDPLFISYDPNFESSVKNYKETIRIKLNKIMDDTFGLEFPYRFKLNSQVEELEYSDNFCLSLTAFVSLKLISAEEIDQFKQQSSRCVSWNLSDFMSHELRLLIARKRLTAEQALKFKSNRKFQLFKMTETKELIFSEMITVEQVLKIGSRITNYTSQIKSGLMTPREVIGLNPFLDTM